MDSSIIREVFSYLITGASTAVAGGTFIHFKAKRKMETQKARQEENIADAGRFENLQKEIVFLDQRLSTYRRQQEKQNKRIARLEKIVSVTKTQKVYAEARICNNTPCQDRIPPLGTFATPNENIDDERDSEKNSE